MKILGLVGTMGSGKDTVADLLRLHHGWEVAAQADALKRVTHAVFDISNEVMFGPSALRATLDPRNASMDYWDECEERACNNVEKVLMDLFPKEHRDAAWEGLHREIQHFANNRDKATARYILQRMGTEWGRAAYKNVWIDALARTIKALQTGNFAYNRLTGLSVIRDPQLKVAPIGVAITDCRFENEVLAVSAWGGKTLWIDASKRVPASGDTHSSEPTFEAFKDIVDGTLDNNGSFEDLCKTVSQLAANRVFWE